MAEKLNIRAASMPRRYATCRRRPGSGRRLPIEAGTKSAFGQRQRLPLRLLGRREAAAWRLVAVPTLKPIAYSRSASTLLRQNDDIIRITKPFALNTPPPPIFPLIAIIRFVISPQSGNSILKGIQGDSAVSSSATVSDHAVLSVALGTGLCGRLRWWVTG